MLLLIPNNALYVWRKPVERIIALAPHITENVFSAGAGDKLVGVVSYSNYPEAAKKLPIVGGYHSLNIEAILALQADLVIMWDEGNGPTLEKLEKLGMTVYVSELRNLDDIPKSIRNISQLAGTETTGEAESQRLEAALTRLKAHYANQKPLSVFYQVWNQPLQTVNGEHMISDVIRLCGGQNSFADVPQLAPKIGIESILQRNPEVIVASGMDVDRPEWLDDWKAYPSLTAVKKDNLYFVPPDFIQRPTARLLQGAEMMCEHLKAARQK